MVHPTLQEPVLSKAHTRFRSLWKWDGQPTAIMSRAIDETGYVQPTIDQLTVARGAGSLGYHLNPITAWHIGADGQLKYRANE